MTTLKMIAAAIVSIWLAATVSPKIQEVVDPCRVFPCHGLGPR